MRRPQRSAVICAAVILPQLSAGEINEQCSQSRERDWGGERETGGERERGTGGERRWVSREHGQQYCMLTHTFINTLIETFNDDANTHALTHIVQTKCLTSPDTC